MIETNYDQEKTQFIVNGFTEGFDLGYEGREDIQMTSPNLKFSIGNKVELWNKVMKEVACKRYAGPYEKIPFENYIQSPIGLVPKDGGTKTRLIFHLSFPRNKGVSVNENTPQEKCTVKYKDFETAMRICSKISRGEPIYFGKSDISSAFRNLPLKRKYWKFLVMKAQSPHDNKWYYFFDKCLPFGASISCAIFQAVSDALAYIIQIRTGNENINYLDDFLFLLLIKNLCNAQLREFLHVCEYVNFPVALEKTEWASTFCGSL